MLARREHSEFELSQKLRKKGFVESEIHITLQALINEGLLSNTRFTECYVRYRSGKGYGPLRIHAELNARGLPQDVIEHHLDMSDNAWLTMAQQVWKKRFKGIIPRDFKARAQQMRFLQYRGFTPEQIDKVFR